MDSKKNKILFFFNNNLWDKFIPLFFCTILLVLANHNFTVEYILSPNAKDSILVTPYFSLSAFYIDYYVFLPILSFAIVVLLFAKNFFVRLFLFIVGLASASLLVYTANDLFTIKFFVFSAWLFVITLSFPQGYNLIAAFLSAILFIVIQTPIQFSASEVSIMSLINIERTDLFSFGSLLFICIFISYSYRFLLTHWKDSTEMANHINMVMTQMSNINNKLQQIAKTRGIEAAKSERMRITRDMHDSCGYTFVNIMSLMDAAESKRDSTRDEIDDTFITIRNLASNGLKETRKTLHAIRDMESPLENNITAIYDIRKLFMQVTKINVEIASGNIKKDYGRNINAIIIHTMQEALTNSIRHGRAQNIYISLWDEDNLLTMIVKDDGVGSKQIIKGIGLAGMEERLAKISGKLNVSSPIEGGFRVEIQIPLTEQEAEKE